MATNSFGSKRKVSANNGYEGDLESSAMSGKKRRLDGLVEEEDVAGKFDRAANRNIKRRPSAPEMGVHDTPFGYVTLTDRGRGAGGMATTSKKNFPGSTKESTTNWSYEQLLGKATAETLCEVEKASRVRSRSSGAPKYPSLPDNMHPDQRRIAAGLSGIERAEEQRNRAAPKAFRAAMRAAAKVADLGGDGKARAKAAFKVFPQAAPAGYREDGLRPSFATGAKALHKPPSNSAQGKRQAAARKQAADEFSDSSDDES